MVKDTTHAYIHVCEHTKSCLFYQRNDSNSNIRYSKIVIIIKGMGKGMKGKYRDVNLRSKNYFYFLLLLYFYF